MADVAQLTGFDRATARRLIIALEEGGYLWKNGRFFQLSAKIVAVAGGYVSANNIGKSIQPTLNQFAEEIKGEISLCVREGNRAVYVAKSTVSSVRFCLGFSIGSTLPLLPTAAGRMLLAQCPHELREEVIRSCVPEKYADETEMDIGSVRNKIQDAEENGYALVSNEFQTGVTGIAVPISEIGGVQAVLLTTSTSRRFENASERSHTIDTLRRAAICLRD